MIELVEKDTKAIERANAYRQMMDLWAWKDFLNFIREVRQSSLESAIEMKDISEIQIARGKVKCIDEIFGELDYILNGTR